MIGIYKITNPENQVYIGQSCNIKRRFSEYKGIGCSGQIRIYESIIKHGVKNHIFEVIKKCDKSDLNNLERYYQNEYDSTGINGLNLMLTMSNDEIGSHAYSTKNKISRSLTGKTLPQYTRDKVRIAMTGRIMSEEWKAKISASQKGRILTADQIMKMRIAMTGKNHTQETKDKISAAHVGMHYKGKMVIDEITGETWKSLSECSRCNSIPITTLHHYLIGDRINKTNFKYIK